MSTLREYRQTYYDASQRASDNARQLAFAGIAFVWLFKAESAGVEGVPAQLYLPALLFAVCLFLDFCHYVIATAVWGSYTRLKERAGVQLNDALEAPRSMNWPAIGFFWAKQVALGWGYIELGWYLVQRLHPML